MKSILVGFLVAVLLSGMAWAHDFYEHERQDALAPVPGASCCAGYDCQPVAAELVSEGDGGFIFLLKPGDHVMVKAPVTITVPYRRIRPSPDGRWHLCLSAGMSVYCVWGPMGGS